MNKLTIPSKDYDAIKDFLGIPDESFPKLLDALKQAKPALHISRLATDVSKKVEMDVGVTRRLIRLFANLYTARVELGMPIPEFVKAFRLAVDENDKLKPEPEKWESVETHLSAILALDESLGVTSKALDVMTEHQNVFSDARVFTEIRPVFGPNPDAPPSATTLFHTLKIHYHDSSEHKEFFVALDSNDIKALHGVIQRAILKEVSLKKWVRKLETPFIDVETQES